LANPRGESATTCRPRNHCSIANSSLLSKQVSASSSCSASASSSTLSGSIAITSPSCVLYPCFDDQLEFAIEQWLCGRHVVADSPRGFANEVNFVIGNGDKEDDDSQQLIDYLMSTPYDWDGNTVKFVENE